MWLPILEVVLAGYTMSHIITITRNGPGQSQELGTHSGSPKWVVGTQVIEASVAASQGACYTRKLESGLKAESVL